MSASLQARLARLTFFTLFSAAVAGAVLLLWGNSIAPVLLIGGAGAAAIGLLLLQHPLQALYVALFIRLIPVAFPPPYGIAYTVLANTAIQLALGAWIIHIAAERRPVLWTPATVLLATYIVWSSITLLWAPDLEAGAIKLVQYFAGFVLVFLITNEVRSVRALDGLMTVLGVTGWLMIALGLYAVVFTDFHFGERLKVLYPCRETSGWLCAPNNENQFGTVLILMMAGAIWPALRSSGIGQRIHVALSAVFILSTMTLIALSGSRGSALSLLILLAALSMWRPVRPWGLAALALIAGLLAAAPLLVETLGQRFAEEPGGELGGRSVLWEASLMLLANVPWTGVGLGNGPVELHNYIAALTSAYDHRFDLPSHNPFLEAGIETGVFGLTVYTALCASAVWRFLADRPRSPVCKQALAGYFPLLSAIAAGYLASWIKSGGIENHPTFFVLLALLLIPSQLSQDPEVHGGGNRAPLGSAAPPRVRGAQRHAGRKGPSSVVAEPFLGVP